MNVDFFSDDDIDAIKEELVKEFEGVEIIEGFSDFKKFIIDKLKDVSPSPQEILEPPKYKPTQNTIIKNQKDYIDASLELQYVNSSRKDDLKYVAKARIAEAMNRSQKYDTVDEKHQFLIFSAVKGYLTYCIQSPDK
jgi:hypothetical protein